MSAEEVEAAAVGDLHDTHTQRAVQKLWRLFLAHAHEIGGSERAARANLDERPRRAEAAAARSDARTLYAGHKPDGEPRRASLEPDATDEASESLVSVTEAAVAERVRLQARLDERDDERRTTPASGVHARMIWQTYEDGGDTKVWADGENEETDEYHAIYNKAWRTDPVQRLAMRHMELEDGRAELVTRAGRRVAMDADEQQVLDPSKRGRAEAVMQACAVRTMVQLHIVHHFTDAWSGDGSKKTASAACGRTETRTACGATEGAVEIDERHGESMEQNARRSLSAGMIGARLPASLEVVDAELLAMLLALRSDRHAGPTV